MAEKGKHVKKSKMKIWIFAFVALGLALAVYAYASRDKGPGQYDDFAKCISDSGAIMYGAYWCTHCQAQKDLFGSSFQYINYVECEQQKETCLREGIEGYPTWKFGDGTEQSGEIGLFTLSQKTGCSLYEQV